MAPCRPKVPSSPTIAQASGVNGVVGHAEMEWGVRKEGRGKGEMLSGVNGQITGEKRERGGGGGSKEERRRRSVRRTRSLSRVLNEFIEIGIRVVELVEKEDEFLECLEE